ncbi:MAG TPA: S8 family serine peptidase [Blastocatellia bacterium]|nr:S8 family serine peptidase [Blastocatellia bacterium]
MTWTFKLRGREVDLETVDDLVAVPNVEPADEAPVGGLPAVRSFERHGWRLCSHRRAAALSQPSRRILRHRSGTMLIETDLLTVQVAPDIPEHRVDEVLEDDHLTRVRRLAFAANAYEVRVSPDLELRELVDGLQRRTSRYRFAEPTFLQTLPKRAKPTDPGFAFQWQHSNAGADLHSEKAWALTRGRGLRIAVIDHGMQVNHPDLRDGIIGGGYFSSAESGSNFAPYRNGMADFPDDSHGTFCLGMAGARMNNARGVCGSAPESDLIAVACDRVGTMTTLARAIAYAADPRCEEPESQAAGADVISCSLGPDGTDTWEVPSVVDLALTFAATEGRNGLGIPIFWAVNNGYRPIQDDQICSHELVIAVGRSNRYDQSDGGAFGHKLEFLAPGADVYSTKSNSRYGSGSGTSYSAPLAAGVAALVLACHPQLTRAEVLDRLRSSCDRIGGVTYEDGRHPDYGYGRLNAEKAVGVS